MAATATGFLIALVVVLVIFKLAFWHQRPHFQWYSFPDGNQELERRRSSAVPE